MWCDAGSRRLKDADKKDRGQELINQVHSDGYAA